MNKILVLGAFDRYNYGDLLFPIIIEQQLLQYRSDLAIQFFGIVKSDLSALGGKPTQDIEAFYKLCESGEQRVNIIIAGGEAVAVTWHSLLVALKAKYRLLRRYQHHLERFIDLNQLGKRILKGKTTLPFVINSRDFKNVDHVLFNSLGGSEIPKETFEKVKGLKEKLQQVDYFSVRDLLTQQRLAEQGITTSLFPDSAILMSKFFPLDKLRDHYVSKPIRSYVEQNSGNYVFFQINRNHAKQQEERLAEQLNKIGQDGAIKICLCPIGKAANHNDDEALKGIIPFLRTEYQFFPEISIWDTMYLIAAAQCYLGTSLHGAITAMSFAVPYVGINVKKLDSYLATWGVEGLNHVVGIPELFAQYARAIQIDIPALEKARDIQFREIEQSFDNMKALLLPE